MTKNKTYKFGPHSFKTYYKTVGEGYEVGITCKGKTYFVGNFIHQTEALRWWGLCNREFVGFAKKHWVSDEVSFQWYCKFMSNYMYSCYYTYLDKLFTKYNKTFATSYKRDYKKYSRMKKTFDYQDKFKFYGAA